MNNVLALVKNFEETVNELQSQKKHMISQFSIDGDGDYIICTDTMISELKAAREAAIPECVPHYDQIIESFSKINEIVNEKNELIHEENIIIQEKIDDCKEAFLNYVASFPENEFNKVIRIGKNKIDEKYHLVIEQVYKKLGFTNIEKNERRDIVYFNINKNNKIRNDIIDTFNEVCINMNIDVLPIIGNFIQLQNFNPENIQDIIAAIKSRI